MIPSSTLSGPVLQVDIAESDTAIFIRFDKALLSEKKIKAALKLLRELQARQQPVETEEGAVPPIDLSGIPAMSDEEQAEVEAMLDALTDEDKEMEYVTL